MSELLQIDGIGKATVEELSRMDPPILTLQDLARADVETLSRLLPRATRSQVTRWQWAAGLEPILGPRSAASGTPESPKETEETQCPSCLRLGHVTEEGGIFVCTACWYRWPVSQSESEEV